MSNITTLEQAKRLKKLGFEYDVHNVYFIHEYTKEIAKHVVGVDEIFIDEFKDNYTPIPTVCKALDWIRENMDIVAIGIAPTIALIRNDIEVVVYEPTFFVEEDTEFVHLTLRHYDDYIEAESALLDAVLTYLENKGE